MITAGDIVGVVLMLLLWCERSAVSAPVCPSMMALNQRLGNSVPLSR